MDQAVDQSNLLLERLLVAMGKSDAAEAERTNLKSWLRSFKTGYKIQTGRITSINNGQEVIDPKRELLQKLLAVLIEASELRKQLGERKKDIQKAGALCVAKAKPRLPMDEFKRRVALSDPKLVDEVAAVEAENIQHLLDTELTEYRKPPLRRHAIEPFLTALYEWGVLPSPRELPMNRIMEAFFDYLEIPQKRRPTQAGVRTIAADMRRQLKNTPKSWR